MQRILHSYFSFLFRILWLKIETFDFQYLKLKRKILVLWKNIAIQICRPLYSEQFCITIFFRISYNLNGKWSLDIDFFQVLTHCNQCLMYCNVKFNVINVKYF